MLYHFTLFSILLLKRRNNERTQRLNHFIIAWHYLCFCLELRNLLGVGEKMKKSDRLSLRIEPELKKKINEFITDFKIKNITSFFELASKVVLDNPDYIDGLIEKEAKELESLKQRIDYLNNKYKSKGEEDEKDNLRQT